MALITIEFTIDADPEYVDPHEVAEEIVEAHRIDQRAGSSVYQVTGFTSAEWS